MGDRPPQQMQHPAAPLFNRGSSTRLTGQALMRTPCAPLLPPFLLPSPAGPQWGAAPGPQPGSAAAGPQPPAERQGGRGQVRWGCSPASSLRCCSDASAHACAGGAGAGRAAPGQAALLSQLHSPGGSGRGLWASGSGPAGAFRPCRSHTAARLHGRRGRWALPARCKSLVDNTIWSGRDRKNAGCLMPSQSIPPGHSRSCSPNE